MKVSCLKLIYFAIGSNKAGSVHPEFQSKLKSKMTEFWFLVLFSLIPVCSVLVLSRFYQFGHVPVMMPFSPNSVPVSGLVLE